MSPRVWPWRLRDDAPPTPPVGEKEEAWRAVEDSAAQLAQARRTTERVFAVRSALHAEGRRNHFAEAISHAYEERRA